MNKVLMQKKAAAKKIKHLKTTAFFLLTFHTIKAVNSIQE
jgi:hypothetical protein